MKDGYKYEFIILPTLPIHVNYIKYHHTFVCTLFFAIIRLYGQDNY
jgi:hypothetical protein